MQQTGEWVAFDIEIGNEFELKPGEDLDSHGPFDITVAAWCDESAGVRHWFTPDGSGQAGPMMTAETAKGMLQELRRRQLAGDRLVAWNGLSFDLRWVGVAAGDPGLAREVALDLIDPMFQFFVARGFPVSLAAVAEGLGVAEAKLMSGADAPGEWARGDRAKVFDYVAGDCRITLDVARRIERAGEVRWRTRRGTVSREPMPEMKAVRDLLNAPEPDTSWMDDPLPRSKFTAWLAG